MGGGGGIGRRARRALAALPGLAGLLCAAALGAAQEPAATSRVVAAPLTGPIVLDGALDEPDWQGAGSLELTQQDPIPGGPTAFRTEVRVLVSEEFVYLGLIATDPEPHRLRVSTYERDADLSLDDNFAFVLDTFGDGRTGYAFVVNAAGARTDGLIASRDRAPGDWDGRWRARTQVTATGWQAEIELAASGLRFRAGQSVWRFNAERYVARERLTLRWTALTLDASLLDLARAGELAGIQSLRQGHGFAAVPYVAGRVERGGSQGSTTTTADLGGELSYSPSPQLGVVATFNTDFAETEVDSRQLNLTRFPLFFPEKRGFFVEGSNLFEFGLGLSDNPDFIPFYSRRVGLFAGQPLPIDAGVKVLGRAGRFSIAALDVGTGEAPPAPGTNLFASRLTYDMGDHLRLGAIATRGAPDGIRDNALGGLDLLWQTTTFHGDKNLAFGAWSARADGDLPAGNRDGWGFKLDYPNDLWDLSLSLNTFGDALDPALGFLPRPGTRQLRGGVAYQPRPARAGPFGWARQLFFESFYSRVERLDGTVESWRLFLAPWNVTTQSGARMEANYAPYYERLDEPFEIAPGVVIPPGDYRFDRFRVELYTASTKRWRVGTSTWFGELYGGHLTQSLVEGSWHGLGGRLSLEASGELGFGYLPQGNFVQRIWQLRTVYSFSPDIALSALGQYDSESNEIGVNSRLRWTLAPGSDLFVVWNRGWVRAPEAGFAIHPERDLFVVKLRWTFAW